MAFAQTGISNQAHARSAYDLVVSWDSSLPAGTTYQVYLSRSLAWWGTTPWARFPWPQGPVDVEVGAVADGEGPTDFSASLPAAPLDRAALSWLGGTFLSPAIAGYRVYASAVAGGPVSVAAAVDTVGASHGAPEDGWGLGGYNQGGWGLAASSYAWTSPRLGAGTWTLAIVPFDTAGNASAAPTTAAVTIAAPPRPPAPDRNRNRLSYLFATSTRVATLTWNASPGA